MLKSFLQIQPSYSSKIFNSEIYTRKFKDLFIKVKTQESCLLIRVFDDYVNRDLSLTLEDGMYEFVSNDIELLNALQDVCDRCRPIELNVDDVMYL